MIANNLQIEYLSNPIGIDIKNPQLTWICDGGKKQTAYKVVCKIKDEIVFDTGKVSSSSMRCILNVPYASGLKVSVFVCLWDEDDACGNEVSCSFEYGLLNKEDWVAKYISANIKPSKKERYPVDCFRKKFITSDVVAARLYISSLGLYEAKINGKRVGEFVMAPGSTDNRVRTQYQVYDVSSILADGENEITCELADGWYRGSSGSKGRVCTYGYQTKLIAQLEIEHSNGDISCVVTDNSWDWSNDGPIRFADLKDGEILDANMVPTYSSKAKTSFDKTTLSASNNVIVKEHECFKPIRLIQTPKGKKVIEFDQNLCGYLSFNINAKKNDRIFIRLGELIDKEGEFTQKNIQCLHKGKLSPLQQIEYICKEGLNEYKTKFFYGGFKYAEIETDVEYDINDFTQIAVYSDIKETMSFDSSNELLNRLVKSTVWSLKSNSMDIPSDCPTRERMGWTGDSQIFFNTASFLTNYAAFSRKHVRDIYDRQWRNGKLPQITPFANEDWFMNTMNGSVGWACAGVYIPLRQYKKYGDIRFLEDNYEGIKKYAKFMVSRQGKRFAPFTKPLGISLKNRRYAVNFGQSYGEWAEPDDVCSFVWTDFAAPHPEESTAYTYYTLSKVVEIAKLLGKDNDAKYFEKYSNGAKVAYNEMITKERFSLDTDRQAKLVRPLYMGILDDKTKEFAKERLIKALDNYGWRLGTGFLSTPFILYVLQNMDIEYAYRLLENEEIPGWLSMPKNGANTIWESWEGPACDKDIASLNHYSKGAVLEWVFCEGCGINMDGENHFVLSPNPGGTFKYMSAKYDSIYGRVSCGWKNEENDMYFVFDIPTNCSATVVLPNGTKQEYESGTYAIKVAKEY